MTHATSVLLSLTLPGVIAAQQRDLERGDQCLAQAQVQRAIQHFERAAKAGAPDSAVAARLADCYLDLRSMSDAERWFSRAVASDNVTPRVLLRYANTQRACGRYDEADRTMLRYAMMATPEQRSRWGSVDANTIRALASGTRGGCQVEPLPINTSGAEISPRLHGDRLVFASDRSNARSDTWNGQPYLDLYEAALRDGIPDGPKPLSELNTRYHESHASFSADDKEVWFDRNNFHEGQKGRNKHGVMEMRIYSRKNTNGAWSDEMPFPLNGEQGSTCHPSLSPSGDILFFASDRPGGHGGSDIWYARRDAQGHWQDPVCLGPEVNTEGDEGFPFLSPQGDLYFASDGHPGLGGLDILRCPFDGRKACGRAMNPGVPLNSSDDDFGIVMTADGAHGYFVSNRVGGAGGDDIYRAAFPEPVVGAQGLVRDRVSQVLLPGTRVKITDKHGETLDSSTVDSNGEYRIAMWRGREQLLEFSYPGYRTLSFPVETPLEGDTVFRIDPRMAFLRTISLWMFVTDSHTGEGIPGAEIMVIDVAKDGRTLIDARTDLNGDHRHPIRDASIEDSLVYRVRLSRVGYYPKKGLFLYVVPDSGEIAMHHVMDISMDPIVVGADAGKSLELSPIQFNVGRWDILPPAATELDKIVALLEENPSMTIELRGHTDSRGSSASNRALSAKRAKSAADYIVGSGIFADRIRSRGYGESALLNGCADGVSCGEDEHAINRRTEFIVLQK